MRGKANFFPIPYYRKLTLVLIKIFEINELKGKRLHNKGN